jgi:hypothetical protein
VRVTTREQWRAWLAEHAAHSPGCWLQHPRRGGATYEELVLEALCVGWIDGQARAVDQEWTALLMTPRKRGSGWARTNKARVEALEAAGLMQAAGRAAVEAAKADGSWTLLDSAERWRSRRTWSPRSPLSPRARELGSFPAVGAQADADLAGDREAAGRPGRPRGPVADSASRGDGRAADHSRSIASRDR